MLTLKRIVYTQDCTIGDLSKDGEHLCYIMEPPVRDEADFLPDRTAIPAGIYDLELYFSPKRQINVIKLNGTPEKYGCIEIHPGNFPKDTEGCLLPGVGFSLSDVTDEYVGPSRIVFTELMKLDIKTEKLQVVDTFKAVKL